MDYCQVVASAGPLVAGPPISCLAPPVAAYIQYCKTVTPLWFLTPLQRKPSDGPDYGSISFDKKLVHLRLCGKTSMQTYCGFTNCAGNSHKTTFSFEGFRNLASVISYPYCIPIFNAAFSLAKRMRRHQQRNQPPPTTTRQGSACTVCGRVCASTFGLRAHMLRKRVEQRHRRTDGQLRERRVHHYKRVHKGASQICHNKEIPLQKLSVSQN